MSATFRCGGLGLVDGCHGCANCNGKPKNIGLDDKMKEDEPFTPSSGDWMDESEGTLHGSLLLSFAKPTPLSTSTSPASSMSWTISPGTNQPQITASRMLGVVHITPRNKAGTPICGNQDEFGHVCQTPRSAEHEYRNSFGSIVCKGCNTKRTPRMCVETDIRGGVKTHIETSTADEPMSTPTTTKQAWYSPMQERFGVTQTLSFSSSASPTTPSASCHSTVKRQRSSKPKKKDQDKSTENMAQEQHLADSESNAVKQTTDKPKSSHPSRKKKIADEKNSSKMTEEAVADGLTYMNKYKHVVSRLLYKANIDAVMNKAQEFWTRFRRGDTRARAVEPPSIVCLYLGALACADAPPWHDYLDAVTTFASESKHVEFSEVECETSWGNIQALFAMPEYRVRVMGSYLDLAVTLMDRLLDTYIVDMERRKSIRNKAQEWLELFKASGYFVGKTASEAKRNISTYASIMAAAANASSSSTSDATADTTTALVASSKKKKGHGKPRNQNLSLFTEAWIVRALLIFYCLNRYENKLVPEIDKMYVACGVGDSRVKAEQRHVRQAFAAVRKYCEEREKEQQTTTSSNSSRKGNKRGRDGASIKQRHAKKIKSDIHQDKKSDKRVQQAEEDDDDDDDSVALTRRLLSNNV